MHALQFLYAPFLLACSEKGVDLWVMPIYTQVCSPPYLQSNLVFGGSLNGFFNVASLLLVYYQELVSAETEFLTNPNLCDKLMALQPHKVEMSFPPLKKRKTSKMTQLANFTITISHWYCIILYTASNNEILLSLHEK